MNNDIPILCVVINIESDLDLINDIAHIERLVQPLDSWVETTLLDLLNQDIYECWAVLEPNLATSSQLIETQRVQSQSRDIEFEVEVDVELVVEKGNNASDNDASRKVIAYCVFSKVFEVADILRIGTHPDFQRQGYSQGLLKLFIKHMPNKGLQKILLEVRADNTPAINLYKKIGFHQIHRRKGYYPSHPIIEPQGSQSGNSRDALIMEYHDTDATLN